MSILFGKYCPRCGCCSVESAADGTMTCIGACDANGHHEPETPEEWRELIAEKDTLIARLRKFAERFEE